MVLCQATGAYQQHGNEGKGLKTNRNSEACFFQFLSVLTWIPYLPPFGVHVAFNFSFHLRIIKIMHTEAATERARVLLERRRHHDVV